MGSLSQRKKEGLPRRGTTPLALHQDKRRSICYRRLGMLTSNRRQSVSVQTPLGICAFVKLQARSRTVLR
jgi:hypothetical protein